LEIPNKSLNLGKQTLNIMKKLVQKITQSTEWEVLTEMSKPKILLGAIALNAAGLFFMYAILDVILFIHYDL
jgi:hypothetical protein